ncbi:TIGR01777 family oxidoreductase [Paenibacillus hodogayensis]|uniref:TIGR01777 family oxidoreductase n=1 Tax=Paenibacillus hodogayensis TaxID=279208 RepID=A0ABV5W8A1_9BACL
MRIAISGGTGLIGSRLVRYLQSSGDEVILISRSSAGGMRSSLRTVTWDRLNEDRQELEGLDGIVNLSGESINQRWTAAAKRRVLESRLSTVRRLAELTGLLKRKPNAVVSGSAMGIYGTSETGVFDESSGVRGNDFLAGVVQQWERAAGEIQTNRLVLLRTGLVLAPEGGALPLMALPYKLGVGGRVGSGRQWMSWIHAEDIVRLIRHCLDNPEMTGPVNATAPNPVTNDEFGRSLGRALHRPHWLPLPGAALKLALGEMSEMLLTGQRVLPQKALECGFEFRYPGLDAALKELYDRPSG